MSSSVQTVVALVIVALTVGWLLYSAFGNRRASGCGSSGCGAVSPDIKKLQARLRR